jgi:hypothetical protein
MELWVSSLLLGLGILHGALSICAFPFLHIVIAIAILISLAIAFRFTTIVLTSF